MQNRLLVVLRIFTDFLRTPSGIPFIILILLLGLFSVLSAPGLVEGFPFLWNNNGDIELRAFANILNGRVLTGVIVIGVVILMISGEFDLSVGPVMVMGAYIFGTLAVGDTAILNVAIGDWQIFGPIMLGNPLNPILALVIAIIACALLGVFNGAIVTYLRIPSFIVTLGTLFIFLWIISVYSNNESFAYTAGALRTEGLAEPSVWLFDILAIRLRDIFDFITPQWGGNLRVSVFWMMGLALLMFFVMTRTKYGNTIYAIGGNPDAAKSQGVNVRLMKISVFALTSAFAGFAGAILFSTAERIQASSGNQQELFAIAAAVVGGALLTGGFGSVLGGIVGVLTIGTLNTGIVRLSTPLSNSFVNDIPVIGPVIVRLTASDNFLAIVGLTIIGAAVLNTFIRRRL